MSATVLALLTLAVLAGLAAGGALAARQSRARAEARAAQLEEELAARDTTLGELRTELVRLETDLQHAVREQDRLKQDETARREQLREELAQREKHLRTEFENLAEKFLREHGERLGRSQQENLDKLLAPFREQIEGFRKRIEEAGRSDEQRHKDLIGELKALHQLNRNMTEEAANLTRALKGESKTRGDWGEVVLERVLEQSGLTAGREYELQVHLTGAGGGRVQPDAIIRLPGERDVVVDAKLSLNAWERHVSAETDEARTAAMREHVQSLRTHLKGLSDKRYDEAEGVRSLDFVLMFVPVEPAFMAALQSDDGLVGEAFDRRVMLVSPTTLSMVLRIIHQLWRSEAQSRNVQEIVTRAGTLYDKFTAVVEDFDNVGTRLGQARETWEKARARLADGPGNVIRQFEMLRELGAKASKQLPGDLVAEARVAAGELPEADEPDDEGNGDLPDLI